MGDIHWHSPSSIFFAFPFLFYDREIVIYTTVPKKWVFTQTLSFLSSFLSHFSLCQLGFNLHPTMTAIAFTFQLVRNVSKTLQTAHEAISPFPLAIARIIIALRKSDNDCIIQFAFWASNNCQEDESCKSHFMVFSLTRGEKSDHPEWCQQQ